MVFVSSGQSVTSGFLLLHCIIAGGMFMADVLIVSFLFYFGCCVYECEVFKMVAGPCTSAVTLQAE